VNSFRPFGNASVVIVNSGLTVNVRVNFVMPGVLLVSAGVVEFPLSVTSTSNGVGGADVTAALSHTTVVAPVVHVIPAPGDPVTVSV
jgi:hypothetical protein